MNYTNLDDALAALRQLTSTGDALKADLVELVKNVSVETYRPGVVVNADATTVLYSGQVKDTAGNLVDAWEVVDNNNTDLNVRTISKTVAADFLNNDEFKTKVANAFGIPSAQDLDALPKDHPAKRWLGRDPGGPWFETSNK